MCLTCQYTENKLTKSECLLISKLPGKATRRLVELKGLPSDSTCILIAEPGKLDIKRCESGILFINLPS